jgi:hypothetical protein
MIWIGIGLLCLLSLTHAVLMMFLYYLTEFPIWLFGCGFSLSTVFSTILFSCLLEGDEL